MVMGRPKASLHLAAEQKEQLEGIVRSRTLPAGLVKRARVVAVECGG
jgi:putative transposase